MKFNDLCFDLYRHRVALHWERKCVLYVGVFPIIDEQDCAALIREGILKAVASSNADFDMAQQIQRGRFLCRR